MPDISSSFPCRVVSFYRFVTLDDLETLQADLLSTCEELEILGLILLAPEGVNGTLSGNPEAIEHMVNVLDERFGIRQGEVKFAPVDTKPFRRLRVRLKKEIITMRSDLARPTERVGTYVDPQDWNAIISDPDVLVIDTRNDYEVSIGTFERAVDPKLETFTDFVPYVEANVDVAKHKKVAMFCTGGIRCEKASSYMLNSGVETVYHLKGGILKYLETVPQAESLWRGDCFVFDRRIAVNHDLLPANYLMCYHCGWPLTQGEIEHSAYEVGVSCANCIDELSPERAESLRERYRQRIHMARTQSGTAYTISKNEGRMDGF